MSAIDRIVEQLEAERLTPVPRASHAVAVDVDDVAIVLDHIHDWSAGRLPRHIAEACDRLDKAVRRFGSPGEMPGAA